MRVSFLLISLIFLVLMMAAKAMDPPTPQPSTMETVAPTHADTPPPCIKHKAKGCTTSSDCCKTSDQCIMKKCISCVKTKKKCAQSTDCCDNKAGSGCTSKKKCGTCGTKNEACTKSKDCCIDFKCKKNKCI